MKQKGKTSGWSDRYAAALGKHLQQGTASSLKPAPILGRRAVALKLETLDVARLHAEALLTLTSPEDSKGSGPRTSERASQFFAETIVPIEKTHRAARDTDVRIDRLTRKLQRRTAESNTSHRRLKETVIRRRSAEKTLDRGATQHGMLQTKAQQLQKHLQRLTREMLLAQENERRKNSGQLNDEIAQTLLGIHVRLLALRKTTRTGTENLKKGIAETQRLVRQSAKIIKRATHECGIPYET